jgi:hypothetical protein
MAMAEQQRVSLLAQSDAFLRENNVQVDDRTRLELQAMAQAALKTLDAAGKLTPKDIEETQAKFLDLTRRALEETGWREGDLHVLPPSLSWRDLDKIKSVLCPIFPIC